MGDILCRCTPTAIRVKYMIMNIILSAHYPFGSVLFMALLQYNINNKYTFIFWKPQLKKINISKNVTLLNTPPVWQNTFCFTCNFYTLEHCGHIPLLILELRLLFLYIFMSFSLYSLVFVTCLTGLRFFQYSIFELVTV